MRKIALLITNQYQIHHYQSIARHLGPVTFVIEIRDRDFEVDEAFVRRHVPDASVMTIPAESLRSLDGIFDVIVCQTPVLPNLVFEKSLVVAQQYSLAKETYQYGVWRSLPNLNLMYGEYSVDRVRGFSNAVAVGNPMFDRWFERDRRPADPQSSARHGLYLPTYGSLSSIPLVAPHLAELDGRITVKLHHSEGPELAELLPGNCVVLKSDADPVDLYESADYVISDMSGAAYDALYARRPLVLVGTPVVESDDYHRLSATDLERGLLSELAAGWQPGESFERGDSRSVARLDDEQRLERFTTQLFSNPGNAGKACADAILDVLEYGEPSNFGREQVRDRNAELMARTYELAADNRRLHQANDRLRSRPRRVAARTKNAVLRQLRPALAKAPRSSRPHCRHEGLSGARANSFVFGGSTEPMRMVPGPSSNRRPTSDTRSWQRSGDRRCLRSSSKPLPALVSTTGPTTPARTRSSPQGRRQSGAGRGLERARRRRTGSRSASTGGSFCPVN